MEFLADVSDAIPAIARAVLVLVALGLILAGVWRVYDAWWPR